MRAYYNEIEPFCVAVLKTLVERGEIPDGDVDSRDVRTVCADELRDYGHIHLFAGIGGFAKGFKDAGFPENKRILTFGFPCQDLSVAGKRGGLSASRSGLFFEAARLVGGVKPDWFICENVPGLLSSNQGKDFQLVIQTLSELGYGVAWRILDSQYFGVAQRRRRVFIVGCLGKPCPAEILFESESLRGNSETGREKGKRPATEVARSITQSCWKENEPQYGEISEGTCYTLNRTEQHAIAFNWPEDRNFRADERNTNPLRVQQTEAVAFAENQRGEIRLSRISAQLTSGGGKPGQGYPAVAYADVCGSLHSHKDAGGWQPNAEEADDRQVVSSPLDTNGVRDFTGLPEGLDSPRYKALGNAVTTKTVAWIASRIKAYLSSENEL